MQIFKNLNQQITLLLMKAFTAEKVLSNLPEEAIRFGLKLWYLCLSDGHLVYAESYCGSDTDQQETELEQRPEVVFSLIDKCKLEKGSTVTIRTDNLLTSLPLLNKLTNLEIYELGTKHKNRRQGAPLKKKADLQKQARRFFDFASNGKNLLATW